MYRRPKPGLLFYLVTDVGIVVGLASHDVPKMGHLVWVSEEAFDEEPTLGQAGTIERWRWCVFFPLTQALNRRIVYPIGQRDVPDGLRNLPPFRSLDLNGRWVVTNPTGDRISQSATRDMQQPLVVNDTALREMVVSGWRPELDW